MKNFALLGARLALGGYLASHAVQKLTGDLGGPGLEKAGEMFEDMGLEPGRPMAALAGGTELAGAVLTAAGVLDPIGPLAIAGAMGVAATGHRANGPFAKDGGFELPAAFGAAALALAAAGPGRFSVGPRLPKPLRAVAWLGAAAAAAAMVAKMVLPDAHRDVGAATDGPAVADVREEQMAAAYEAVRV